MNREAVRAGIEKVGIVPAVRVSSREDALFAATAVNRAGIPIAEITVTVPEAVEVIRELRRSMPEMIVGAGTVLDQETAHRCVQAGAQFLTSPGLVIEVVEFAKAHEITVFPGALTPSEIIAAWKAGADFVKVFPCAPLGGENYIRTLKKPFPDVPLIASGGVNQQTAHAFLIAGAAALGIGAELIPQASVQLRREDRIMELARRFMKMVKEARQRTTSQ